MTYNDEKHKDRINDLLTSIFGIIDYDSIVTKKQAIAMPFGKIAWKELRSNALKKGENPDETITYMDIKNLAISKSKEYALNELKRSDEEVSKLIIKRDKLRESKSL